jgi:hypothetical protein
MDMNGNAAWYAAWALSIGMKDEHAACTCSKDLQQGEHDAGTCTALKCSMDM